MKMVCKRESLLSACQLASTAVPSKDVKPVLRNLKAIVDEKFCTLMATDLELGIRLEVRGIEANEPGDALFPANRMISILRESPAEELTIDAGMDATIITAGSTEFEMAGEDPAAFPDIPTFAEEKYTEMTAGTLRDMIRRVSFAVASAEHSRFGATIGVLWELEAEKATLVATDGRRLALSIGPCQSKGGHTTKGTMPVVPLKAMTLLERNLDSSDELVKIAFRPNEVLMKTERAMLYSRLVEGKFPNYRQAIPKDGAHRVNLTVGPFLSAVRQAAIMTDDESKRVVFTFAKGTLTLQARGAQTGRSKVEMPIEYKGESLAMGFDPKFIGDMLKVLEPDTPLTLDVTDPNTPAVFRQDPNYLYVVVPLVTTG
jgi:DNA polymerase-3 subunit beta